jgi:hypothetical protein
VIADQIGGDLWAVGASCDHVLYEVMIRVTFVRESLAVCGHRDDAWLGAIDEVGHYSLRAVLPRRNRNRNPSCGVRKTGVHLAPDLLRES